jgi:hypothetical protein
LERKQKHVELQPPPLDGLEQRKNIGIVEDMSCTEEIPVAPFVWDSEIEILRMKRTGCGNSMKVVLTNLVDYNVL